MKIGSGTNYFLNGVITTYPFSNPCAILLFFLFIQNAVDNPDYYGNSVTISPVQAEYTLRPDYNVLAYIYNPSSLYLTKLNLTSGTSIVLILSSVSIFHKMIFPSYPAESSISSV